MVEGSNMNQCHCLLSVQNYVFFLAQLQNVGYLITYFTALAVR
jgi:hypothetical protein